MFEIIWQKTEQKKKREMNARVCVNASCVTRVGLTSESRSLVFQRRNASRALQTLDLAELVIEKSSMPPNFEER